MAVSDPIILPEPLTRLKAYVAALASPVQRVLLQRGIRNMEAQGWQVEIDRAVYDRGWLTAGDVATRLAAIERWWSGECPLLLIARGGYGTMELLPRLAGARWRQKARWILGSSDSTALQMWMLQQAGLGSLYGPMPSSGLARDPSPKTLARLAAVVTGAGQGGFEAATGKLLTEGEASGRAVGGCLSMVAALVGSGWLPTAHGRILFLEDIGEAPYRIERMLQQLGNSGWLSGIVGVVLGTFPGCQPHEGSGYTLAELFARFFAPCKIPVWWGHPFGHVRDGDPCDTVLLGGYYALTASGPVLL